MRLYGKLFGDDYLPNIRISIYLSYCTSVHMHFADCEIYDAKNWNIPQRCNKCFCRSLLVHTFTLLNNFISKSCYYKFQSITCRLYSPFDHKNVLFVTKKFCPTKWGPFRIQGCLTTWSRQKESRRSMATV